MSFAESVETTKIYSVMGMVGPERALVVERPFRAPHHTISDAGLIGGGPVPRPGEVSLAHNGVLFLDELPEFRRHVLEVLRQPLEDGAVTIARAALSLTYPARSMLVAAMNPCPCGHLGDTQHPCVCSLQAVQRYRARVSGPLLDRIDIHVEVPAVRFRELSSPTDGEPSKAIRARVDAARVRQRQRFRKHAHIHCNAQMTPRLIRRMCAVDAEGEKLLSAVVDRLGMSARAYDRILRLARTIADLAGSDALEPTHVAEAIQYRTLDRKLG
jgi:magnesium chelatase family protein